MYSVNTIWDLEKIACIKGDTIKLGKYCLKLTKFDYLRVEHECKFETICPTDDYFLNKCIRVLPSPKSALVRKLYEFHNLCPSYHIQCPKSIK